MVWDDTFGGAAITVEGNDVSSGGDTLLMNPEAGWYRDPLEEELARWWDGNTWTEQTWGGAESTVGAGHGPAQIAPEYATTGQDAALAGALPANLEDTEGPESVPGIGGGAIHRSTTTRRRGPVTSRWRPLGNRAYRQLGYYVIDPFIAIGKQVPGLFIFSLMGFGVIYLAASIISSGTTNTVYGPYYSRSVTEPASYIEAFAVLTWGFTIVGAAICHQLAGSLIGIRSTIAQTMRAVFVRILRIVVWTIALGILFFIANLGLEVVQVWAEQMNSEFLQTTVRVGRGIAVLYLYYRLIFFLPALMLAKKNPISLSWELTSGGGVFIATLGRLALTSLVAGGLLYGSLIFAASVIGGTSGVPSLSAPDIVNIALVFAGAALITAWYWLGCITSMFVDISRIDEVIS